MSRKTEVDDEFVFVLETDELKDVVDKAVETLLVILEELDPVIIELVVELVVLVELKAGGVART